MDQILNLNPAQQAAFSTFKQLCTEQGLLALTEQPGFGNGDVSDGLNDDVTLLRFLQARKFNPAEALEQYREARAFHAEKGILRLYDSMGVDDYEDTRRLYPHWTGRRTKTGLPIMILDTSHLDSAAITHWRSTCNPTATNSPDMAQRVCVFHDTTTRFILPLCSAIQMPDQANGSSSSGRETEKKPVTNCLYLIDVSTVTLKQAWSLADFGREVSWILERCYPETIQCIMLCNAPTSFTLFWTIIKKFLDPATVDKLLVLRSAEVYPVLSQHIEHGDIPTRFGGAFDFERGNERLLPVLDWGLCEVLGWDSPTNTDSSGGGGGENDGSKCSKSGSEEAAEMRLPPGPLKWVRDGDDDGNGVQRKAIATGRIGDVQRSETIATLDVK